MYLGIDVGGTKTLVAALDDDGVIKQKIKFPTNQDYSKFLDDLQKALGELETKEFIAGGIGVPGNIDRKNGVGLHFGNLPWQNVPILSDVQNLAGCPMALENDAKMAGLSEAMLIKSDYSKMVYVTVSTGIGIALVVDGKIDSNFGDGGGRHMQYEYDGKQTAWEDFASGRAIVERFGKRAEDIHDDETWRKICRNLCPGLVEIIGMVEPQVIVFGGSVGTWFDRYGAILAEELTKYELPTNKTPRLLGAQRPEEAVIYGCYDLAKQEFPDAGTNR